MNEVDDGEQRNSYDVDEVLVVRHHDRSGGLGWGELTHSGSDQQEDEGDQFVDDVQVVEVGC
ncbi:MAG: hypothetical protein O7C59_07990 [Rickettsia endosymbiont of Ixodes persulcatus]|nr:hypothetical protein [Rickettsia endosymbiont of Ixodes persulcatus]